MLRLNRRTVLSMDLAQQSPLIKAIFKQAFSE